MGAVTPPTSVRCVAVTDFQSLASVRLELGQLTAVVGPSNSGKSALVRALRCWALGGRGTWFVRHGAADAVVEVGFGPAGVVRVTRGAHNSYQVHTPTLADTFTKLAGAVPEPVAKLLAITELSFAGQFDRPFLVGEPGAAVARTLASLTAVDRIYAAAREAVRRRRAVAAELRAQQEVLAELTARAASFADLPAQRAAVAAAEAALADAEVATLRAHRLRELTETARVAEAVVARSVALPALPDLDAVLAATERVQALAAAIETVRTTASVRSAATGAHAVAVTAEADAAQAFTVALAAAGRCPLCGQPVGTSHRGDREGHD